MSLQQSESNMVENLLEKAIEIFSIKGYEATKLTDITNALGISRGPIYYHFKDKLGLYEAAYNRFEIGLKEIHATVFAQDKPIMDLMEEMIFEFVKHISTFGLNFFFMVDFIDDLSNISYRYNSMNSQLYLDKIELIKLAQSNGELINDIPPKMIVDHIYLIYFGIIDGINYKVLCEYSDHEIKTMVSLLNSGLRNMCISTTHNSQIDSP